MRVVPVTLRRAAGFGCMRTLLSGGLAILALAGAAPGVRASVLAELKHVPLSGPDLVEGGAVFAAGDYDEGFSVRFASPGEPSPRLLQAFRRQRDEVSVSPLLVASQRRVGVEVFSVRSLGVNIPGGSFVQAFQGALGSALSPLSPACDVPRGDVANLDVTDDAAVYLDGSECSPGLRGASATDFATSPPESRRLSRDADGLTVAGDLVGFFESGQRGYQIFDRPSGVVIRRVELPAVSEDSAFTGIDLRADGAVLFAFTEGPRGHVALAEPDAARAQRLDLPSSARIAAGFHGGQLLLSRAPHRRAPNGIDGTTLELRDLQGRLLQTLARGAVDTARRGDRLSDGDGERVTFVERRCDGARLHLRRSDERELSFPRARDCPMAIVGRPRIRRGRLEVRARLTCTGLTARCDMSYASATVRVAGRDRRIAYTRDKGTPTFRMRLNARGKRLARSKRRFRVVFRVGLGDGIDAPTALVRRAVLVVRRS